MAPSASKKGASGSKAISKTERRSSSRHSTPLTENSELPNTPSSTRESMARETPYLHTSTGALISPEPSVETLISKSNASVAKAGDPPSRRDLDALHDRIRDTVNKFMSRRGEVCDRSMRQLVQKRKERAQQEREQEAARAEAERAKLKREEDDKRREKKLTKKRSHDDMEIDEDEQERKKKRDILPDVGAHGLARQDGVGVHEGAPPPPTSPPVQPGAVLPDLMNDSGSESGNKSDAPATAPLYERIFGKDPTHGEDPIVYNIREIDPDTMDYEQQQEILQVKKWPASDLHDLTAGDPPDQDFSNAKPANQVNFSTFQTYLEPFIRPYTEEDVAFLKERGDRITPYIVPQRGLKGYKEVWAAEDGMTGLEPPQKHVNNPNEARGSMEDMDNDIADQDTISIGPTSARLLSILRPQTNGIRKEASSEDANGDASMVNGDADDAEDAELAQTANVEGHKPVTQLPADAPRPSNLPQLDYESFEQRAMQELRFIGFIGPSEQPNYDAHDDDEVAARLRTLQHELRRISRLNNIRKARVLELTEERMAMQEYSNIADDLDNQVNAAYLKRNRSLAKPNQKKGSQARPGQKGVASGVVGGRGVSDGVRALMQKRRDWNEMVGPVVSNGRPLIPGDDLTIFDELSLKRLEKVEREEAEMGDADGE